MHCRLAPLAAVTITALFGSAQVSADLVYLTSGRSLSVKSHRVEGDRVVLTLRAGGEIVCDAALIASVEPDEVPYPEEVPDAAGEPVALEERATGAPVGEAFGPLIDRLSREHGVDAALVRAVVGAESGFRPRARSPRGAMGLMQLMPATARRYGVSDAFDPQANLDAGIRHLRWLLDRFDLPLALAAYNAGEGAVMRHGGVPPFAETRGYVDRVLRRAAVAGRHPGTRGTAVAR